jgi:hypothetical protein
MASIEYRITEVWVRKINLKARFSTYSKHQKSMMALLYYLSKLWQKILLLSNVFVIVNCDLLVKTLQNVILPILPGLTRRIKRPFSPSCHGSKTDWKKVARTFRALPLRSKSGLCGRNAGSGQGYSELDSWT